MKSKILILLLFGILKVEAQTSTFFKVDSLFERGRYKLALSQLDKIEKSSFFSNYKTAVIYESIDNYAKTILFLEKALVYKKDYKAKLKLAKAYLKINKPSKTINMYESILTKDSLNLVLKYQLGKLYLMNKNAEKAISIFKGLIQKDSLNANYSYQLGLSFSLINDRDRMINSFLDTHSKDSTHLKSILRLASSFNKLNDKDSTQIFINKGLLIDSNHIALNKLNINQLYRDKKYQVAIVSLLKLDSVVKNDTYVASMLGRSYYNLDSLNKADEYFKKLYLIDKENYKSFTYRGHIASKEKKFKDAETLYRMATYIGKEKRDEEFYGLGIVNYELKKAKQALFYFDKAFKENIKNYKALYQLAKLSDDYYKDKKIAYKYYTKYLDRFIDKDLVITDFIKGRIKEIKMMYFMRGESLE